MVWMQCRMLLLLLELQAADGLLTPLSVGWCICESVCSEKPASVWDTGSAGIQVSAVASSLSSRRTCCEERDHRERMEEDQRDQIWLQTCWGEGKDERGCRKVKVETNFLCSFPVPFIICHYCVNRQKIL